jgi:hypothetical protein
VPSRTSDHNITLAGESVAADRMLTLFQTYERDDRQLRGLNADGDLRNAIAFNVGATPGRSYYDFGQYDTALGAFIGSKQPAQRLDRHHPRRGRTPCRRPDRCRYVAPAGRIPLMRPYATGTAATCMLG